MEKIKVIFLLKTSNSVYTEIKEYETLDEEKITIDLINWPKKLAKEHPEEDAAIAYSQCEAFVITDIWILPLYIYNNKKVYNEFKRIFNESKKDL